MGTEKTNKSYLRSRRRTRREMHPGNKPERNLLNNLQDHSVRLKNTLRSRLKTDGRLSSRILTLPTNIFKPAVLPEITSSG